MHARAPRARVKISTRTFGQPMVYPGAALQGGCGGVEHPPTRHQLGKSLTSVGKTGLAKDNH